jgi:putative membrane protein
MMFNIGPFLLYWAIMSFSLWLASRVFKGLKFTGAGALIISALLLGFVNAIVRPLVIFLTLPLTLVTFGLFLLVINALMILLVARIVSGFNVSGFWTAFFAGIFISIVNLVIGAIVGGAEPWGTWHQGANWI